MTYSGASNTIVFSREYFNEFSCVFDLRSYPFDSQVSEERKSMHANCPFCHLQACSQRYKMDDRTGQRAQFIPGKVHFSGSRELVEFEILAERVVVTPENVTELRLLFSRRMEYHVTNTFTQVSTFVMRSIADLSISDLVVELGGIAVILLSA